MDAIQVKITRVNRGVSTMHGMLQNRILSRSMKVKIYKTIIYWRVTGRSNVWTLNKSEKHQLVGKENLLRKEYTWKMERTNIEIRNLHQEPTIVRVIKA